MKIFMFTLLMSMAVTVHAGRLSQAVSKVQRPLQQAVAVVVCAAACLVFNSEVKAYNSGSSPLKEFAVGGGVPGYAFFNTKMGVYLPGDEADGSVFNIDLRYAIKSNDDYYGVYFEHFDAHLFRMFMRPNGITYPLPDRMGLALTGAGYDTYDKRSFELDGGTEGFAAGHLHWMGLDSPIFISKVGVGSLGFVDTGWFEQADLEAWAGDGAEFSYLLFLTNGIGFELQPRHSLLGVGVKVLQSRTIKGDIDFADGVDGNFVALWESAEAKAELIFTNDSPVAARLGVTAAAFRQRISADAETGEKFSQRKGGYRIAGHVSLYID